MPVETGGSLEKIIGSFADRMLKVDPSDQSRLRIRLSYLLAEQPKEALIVYILDGLPRTQLWENAVSDFGTTDPD